MQTLKQLISKNKDPIVMGILNVTPDSFSDGGKYLGLTAAIDHAMSMIEEGALIIDIGGESTRPNAQKVSLETEKARIVPVIKALKKAGDEVYERLVELPMWEEFEKTLESNIADINNLGSSEGQAVCAGFFLKNFVHYPWVHIDIAGPAFRNTEHYYLPKGGTGFGVRLLYQFFKNKFVN